MKQKYLIENDLITKRKSEIINRIQLYSEMIKDYQNSIDNSLSMINNIPLINHAKIQIDLLNIIIDNLNFELKRINNRLDYFLQMECSSSFR